MHGEIHSHLGVAVKALAVWRKSSFLTIVKTCVWEENYRNMYGRSPPIHRNVCRCMAENKPPKCTWWGFTDGVQLYHIWELYMSLMWVFYKSSPSYKNIYQSQFLNTNVMSTSQEIINLYISKMVLRQIWNVGLRRFGLLFGLAAWKLRVDFIFVLGCFSDSRDHHNLDNHFSIFYELVDFNSITNTLTACAGKNIRSWARPPPNSENNTDTLVDNSNP